MMDYQGLADVALSLLVEFGQAVTRVSYTAGSYSVATGEATVTGASTDRTGAIFDFGAGQTLERGSLIQVGDKRLILDATAGVNTQDHFLVGSTEYVIVSIGEISPAGIPVVYDLHLRA